MAKYLVKASYTGDGAKGLQKEGGTARRAAVESMLQGLNGKLEAFYYAFGDTDAYLIVDLPGATAAAALSIVVNATGAVTLSTIPLLTPEEIDEACKTAVSYRGPGR